MIGPIPLNYENFFLDSIINGFSLIQRRNPNFFLSYLGFRPINSFAMHKKFSEFYNFRFNNILSIEKYETILRFIEEERKIDKVDGWNFLGMNPNSNPKDLIFNSIFECGNLDCAIKLNQNEYDLFMRVDANTKGHLQWFYFSVKNMKKNEIVKFNICNFTKKFSLFKKVRIYIQSSK